MRFFLSLRIRDPAINKDQAAVFRRNLQSAAQRRHIKTEISQNHYSSSPIFNGCGSLQPPPLFPHGSLKCVSDTVAEIQCVFRNGTPASGQNKSLSFVPQGNYLERESSQIFVDPASELFFTAPHVSDQLNCSTLHLHKNLSLWTILSAFFCPQRVSFGKRKVHIFITYAQISKQSIA